MIDFTVEEMLDMVTVSDLQSEDYNISDDDLFETEEIDVDKIVLTREEAEELFA